MPLRRTLLLALYLLELLLLIPLRFSDAFVRIGLRNMQKRVPLKST